MAIFWQPAFARAAHWEPETVRTDANLAGGLELTWQAACNGAAAAATRQTRAGRVMLGPVGTAVGYAWSKLLVS